MLLTPCVEVSLEEGPTRPQQVLFHLLSDIMGISSGSRSAPLCIVKVRLIMDLKRSYKYNTHKEFVPRVCSSNCAAARLID